MAELNLLSTGDPIPDFPFRESSGTIRNTSELRGRPFVVYFYPKDDTPGCTKEACGFRDLYSEFEKLGVAVIGVSPDDDESHQQFQTKHTLPFPLASDPDHAISSAFGAWGPKTRMGRTSEGVHRVTFVIDHEGKVARVYPKVKPETHAEEIIQYLTTTSQKT